MIQEKSKLYVEDTHSIWVNATGQTHREDGPAWENHLGEKLWFLNDLEYSEYEHHYKTNGQDEDF